MVMCSVHSIFCITQNVDNGNTGYPDRQNHNSHHHQAPQSNESTDQVNTIKQLLLV